MIRILAVGRLKDRRLAELAAEFIKRSRPWRQIEVVELKDSEIEKEGREMVRWLDANPAGRIVACDENGAETTSRGLSELLGRHGSLTFLIGGPDGLGTAAKDRADQSLALSRMTMTHEMARMLLTEQIYRGLAILRGHRYHRD